MKLPKIPMLGTNAMIIALIVVIAAIWKRKDVVAVAQKLRGNVGDEEINAEKIDVDKILKKGCRGAEVKLLQNNLNSSLEESQKLNPDGIFGMKTENALMKIKSKKEISLIEYAAIVKPVPMKAISEMETIETIYN